MRLQISNEIAEVRVTYKAKVRTKNRPQIKSSEAAHDIFRDLWDEDTIEFFEECYLLLLDRTNRVMGWYKVSKGGTTATVVDPKVIFSIALKSKATSIILAHNHPSGTLRPSQPDEEITRKLFNAGKSLDLPLLDHLILSPCGSFYSFADNDKLGG